MGRYEFAEAFEAAALALRGSVTPPSPGVLSATPAQIRATVGNRPVVISAYGFPEDPGALLCIDAPATMAGFEMRVWREDVLDFVCKTMAIVRDVELGDSAFDRAFVVTSSDPGLARAWLPPSIRDAMLRLRAWPYHYALRDGQVRVERNGLPEDAAALEAAIRTTAALADRGDVLLSQWAALIDAFGSSPEPGDAFFASFAVTLGGVQLRIDVPCQGKSGSITRVRSLSPTEISLSLPKVVLDVGDLRHAIDEVATRAAGPRAGVYR